MPIHKIKNKVNNYLALAKLSVLHPGDLHFRNMFRELAEANLPILLVPSSTLVKLVYYVLVLVRTQIYSHLHKNLLEVFDCKVPICLDIEDIK